MIKRKGYTAIPNEVISNPILSAKAKGIYLYLHSRPDGWVFNEYEITKNFSDGKKSIRSGLKELEEQSLLLRPKQNRESGKFGRNQWILDPTEADTKGVSTVVPKRVDGKRVDGKRVDGKGDTTNKEDTKKEETKKEERGKPPRKRLDLYKEGIKNYMDLKEWIEEKQKDLKRDYPIKYDHRDIKVTTTGKLYFPDNLENLNRRQETLVLKETLTKIQSDDLSLEDLIAS